MNLAHSQWPVPTEACNHVWEDGWGTHRCYLRFDHDSKWHRCPCDMAERKK